MTTFDFQDNNGPVPAHQHSNGGGWVADTTQVEKTAYVGSDAWVYGSARVYGDVQVYGSARVYGDAWVYDSAWVYGNAQVYGSAWVYSNARVYGSAWVYSNARVYGSAWETSPLQIQGTKHFFNLASKTKIAIGCEIHTLAHWKKHYKEIGKKYGYTSTQTWEYYQYICLAEKLMKAEKKKNNATR